MDLIYDRVQLYEDIGEVNKKNDGLSSIIHQNEVLFQVEMCSALLINTLEEANQYLNNLKIIQCCAKHEHPIKGCYVIHCDLKRENISCLHGVEFVHGDYSNRLATGYDIFGIQLFTIAYFLFQQGYKDLDYYLPKGRADSLNLKNRYYDDKMQIHYNSTVHDDKTKNKVQQYQEAIGNEMIEKYVEPVKVALKDYMRKVLCVV